MDYTATRNRNAPGTTKPVPPEDLRALVADNLAGISELTARYDVQPNTVAVWTQRHDDFPKPLIQVGGRIRVWWIPNVERWKATWGIFWRLSLAYGAVAVAVGSIAGIAAATQ